MSGPRDSINKRWHAWTASPKKCRARWRAPYWKEQDGFRDIACRDCRRFDQVGTACSVPFGTPTRKCATAAIEANLNDTPAGNVLEIGFGGAALLERLCRAAHEGHVAGLEISEEMVEMARARLRHWIDSDLLGLSLGSIESLHTTYFWPDLGKGLAELQRVMCPGGRLVLGFLSAADIARAGLYRHGFSLHSLEELKEALAAARFRPGFARSRSGVRGTLYSLVAERY